MNPVIIDGTRPDWEKTLRKILFNRHEADLIHCGAQHLLESRYLAEFVVMELAFDEASRTITFRKPATESIHGANHH
jgi:hypothetical protein